MHNKFENHGTKQDTLWSDFAYELCGYLNNWLDSVGMTVFESLKELILTEQVKKRVPFEIQEHKVDSKEEINTANVLSEKCEKFGALRKDQRRFKSRSFRRNSFKRNKKRKW